MFAGRTVWRDDANSPVSIDRQAFPHEHYEGAAHDRAKGHYESARTLAGDPQRDALEEACGSLRTAYEDFIQKRLFNNVVRRWRENITFTLNQVYFDEVIAERIHDRMAALSRYIDAHSHSEDFREVPLTIDWSRPNWPISMPSSQTTRELVRNGKRRSRRPRASLVEISWNCLNMYDLHGLGWNSFKQLCLTIAREVLGLSAPIQI
ncbi:hypothetical protein [Hydrogenophaga sp. ZJX-1]|uniref:hypothetical protein n=1 Tax=Hydrogenophaga sp. ZJX-1 TaxID=3404778 RepID=UPI003B27F1D9